MPHSENFICLSYSSLSFLIPKNDVISASFCDKSSFIKGVNGDSKIIMSSQIIPYIDVDLFAKYLDQTVVDSDVKTCIVVECKGIFKDSDTFGILTSSDCKVQNISLDEFSLFSNFYNDNFQKMGLLACRFDKNDNSKLGYLIDIKTFLKKYPESLL